MRKRRLSQKLSSNDRKDITTLFKYVYSRSCVCELRFTESKSQPTNDSRV